MYGEIRVTNYITPVSPDHRFRDQRKKKQGRERKTFEDVLNEKKGENENPILEKEHINIKY